MKSGIVVLTVAAVALAGCSDRSPVAPDVPGTADGAGMPGNARPTVAPGIYELSFLDLGQPVESLPVGNEVTHKAWVLNASTGIAVTDGAVTFQYCSRSGRKDESGWQRRSATEGGYGRRVPVLVTRRCADRSGCGAVLQLPRGAID